MSKHMAEAFLDAIRANPDDDTPRLVYADWLDEGGEHNRAEFIRVQCRKAQLKPWHREYSRLAWREKVLLARHEAAWRSELPEVEDVTWGRFERGFVHEVHVQSPRTLSERADTICLSAPVRWATVAGEGDDWENCPPAPYLAGLGLQAYALYDQPQRVFGSPLLSTLTTLDLSGQSMEGEQFAALAASPYLENLQALLLDDCYMGDGNLRPLARGQVLRNLTTLSMRGNQGGYHEDARIRPDDVALLAACPSLARLRSLDLSHNEIDTDSLRGLLASPHLANLRELDLTGNRLTRQGMASLASLATPMRLHRLVLARNPIGDEGAQALAAAAFCAELIDLDLETCEIQSKGVQALGQAPWIGRVGRLNLNHNSAGADGIHALASGFSQELFALHLRDVDLDSEAVKLLAEARSLAGLHTLDLSENPLDLPAMQALASSPHLTQLRELHLERCRLDGLALQALAYASWRHGLVRLTLSDNRIGNLALERLLGRGGMAELNDLALRSCALDSAAAAILAAAGLTQLHWLNLAGNTLGAAGTRVLAGSPLTTNLVELNLNANQVGDKGADGLTEGTWTLLKDLALESNKLTDDGVRTLAASGHLGGVGVFRCRDNAVRWETYRELGARFRQW